MIILLVVCLVLSAQAATMHGTIYEWSDFDKPLKNAIIEVNSTPAQYVVATAGIYSFNLSRGSYLIRAKYYRNNVLEYMDEEVILIDREGDFVHDILLFPSTDSEYEFLGDINLTGDIGNDDPQNNYLIFILIILFSAFMIFYWFKNKKSKKITEKPEAQLRESSAESIPEDLCGLYNTILAMGGRVTQKELRKKMAYSEAKVSLMLDDLEDRGLIKKIRKGRSNIIIADQGKPFPH